MLDSQLKCPLDNAIGWTASDFISCGSGVGKRKDREGVQPEFTATFDKGRKVDRLDLIYDSIEIACIS